MKKKLSDFVAEFIADQGIEHVYMLTGGGSMHLNYSLAKCPKLKTIFTHHEQTCAMAAESHARLTNKMAAINVTTGPGGINAINGVFGAWTDSIPMLILSGQVRYDTTIKSSGLPLRQLGDQECNIVSMVKSITKYAVMIDSPKTIKFHLQKAIYLARSGRPGPVWIDIPMDIQGSIIEEKNLDSFKVNDDLEEIVSVSDGDIEKVINKVRKSSRPVVLVGSGIRLSGAHSLFLNVIEQLNIPVVTAWNAHDVITENHPLYCGRPGTVGDRAGNFIVQNSDLLLVLGSRLNIRQIGYYWQAFARSAYKIMVDIDVQELKKPTLQIDFPIHSDLKAFLLQILKNLKHERIPPKQDWIDWCKARKEKYPVVLEEYWHLKHLVNPYCFMKCLSDALPENQIIITGDGTACVASFQAIKIKQGQRLYTNSGSASMGYDLPAAIGACVASGGKKIICLAGDGSIQMNIQELATIAFNKYPIKIFILNNRGYHSIRQTQKNFFNECVGCDVESGLGFPNFSKLISSYDIPFLSCSSHAELDLCIKKMLSYQGPSVCEIMLTTDQDFAPKQSSQRLRDGRMISKPLEDLKPFLSKEEIRKNMFIPMLEEKGNN